MEAIYPLWRPTHPYATSMWQFMRAVGIGSLVEHAIQDEQALKDNAASYQALHAWSLEKPDLFWPALCDFFKVEFDTPPQAVLNDYQAMWDAQWFTGARFNFAQKLLSNQSSRTALVSINEAGQRQSISYAQLYSEVAQCAAGLKALGVTVGDRVAAVMPNTAQTIIAMLATTSLGAIWSSCSPDFGAEAAVDRLGQVSPKVLFITDGHQYLGKVHSAAEKIAQLHAAIPSLMHVVICTTIKQKIDLKQLTKALYWEDFVKPAQVCEFVSLPFNHPVYILFSSGTTGKPKCIVHGAGGTLLQHIKELGLHVGLSAEDNLCFYTTCGWMMWNWTVSALALGACLTLYEGAPMHPADASLLQWVAKEKVTVFGTSAKYLQAIEKAGVVADGKLNLSALRCILSTGSPLLPKSFDYVYQKIKPQVQLSSISGGTDIVSCFALGNPMLPVYRGALQCLGLGMAVAVYNEQGKSVVGERGELVCTQPFPSMPVGFWQDATKTAYKHAYFERFSGLWAQGDFAEITVHQGLIIYGRSDAVLNPGGVRIGTAEIYRQVEQIEDILDSVVIAQSWEDDVRIVLFVKLKPGVELTQDLVKDIKQTIKKNASPRHVPAVILQVADIPRTINGKVVELAVRQVVQGEPVNNLHSLANPEALEYFKNRAELQ